MIKDVPVRELLLGCGHSRERRMGLPGTSSRSFDKLTTVDSNRHCLPNVCMHLDDEWKFSPPDFFDEVHAYEVLEHLGKQGDIYSFFEIFTKIYHVLKPNGYLFATVPSRFGPWLWGDPGHTRVITRESLTFLDQTNYEQCGITTMSDYRYLYESDFKIIHIEDDRITLKFILQAIKPSRITKDD